MQGLWEHATGQLTKQTKFRMHAIFFTKHNIFREIAHLKDDGHLQVKINDDDHLRVTIITIF